MYCISYIWYTLEKYFPFCFIWYIYFCPSIYVLSLSISVLLKVSNCQLLIWIMIKNKFLRNSKEQKKMQQLIYWPHWSRMFLYMQPTKKLLNWGTAWDTMFFIYIVPWYFYEVVDQNKMRMCGVKRVICLRHMFTSKAWQLQIQFFSLTRAQPVLSYRLI